MLRWCALLVSALAAWSWPASAWACKCAPPPPIADALLAADAVFEGQVTKLTPSGVEELVVELRVVRTFKGANTEQIKVRTPAASSACGYPFTLGESYLVYAEPIEASAGLPALVVRHCGRTSLMTEAEADLGALGMGVVPVTPSSDDLPPGAAPKAPGAVEAQQKKPAAGGCASCSSTGGRTTTLDAGVGLLLLLMGFVRLRRRVARSV